MRLEDIIQRPLVTEKSTRQAEKANEYFFAVNPNANKTTVRLAVEKLFKVKVESVHIQNVCGKLKRMGSSYGRKPDWKKAIVRLKEKETIQLFEGK